MTPRLLIHMQGGCIQQIWADGNIVPHVTDADLLGTAHSNTYCQEHHVDIITRTEMDRRLAEAEAKNTVDQFHSQE